MPITALWILFYDCIRFFTGNFKHAPIGSWTHDLPSTPIPFFFFLGGGGVPFYLELIVFI